MKPLTEATEKLLKPLPFVDEKDRIYLDVSKGRFLMHHYSRHVLQDGSEEKRFPRSFNFYRRFPEIKEVKTGNPHGCFYELPISDYTVEIINHAWPREQLRLSQEAIVYYKNILLQSRKDELGAENVANFKNNKVLPLQTNFFDYHPQYTLLPYQKIALLNSYNNPSYSLYMKQGTGKTAVVVSRVCNEARKYTSDRMYRSIIVCPTAVCENWAKEFEKFGTVSGKVTVIHGTKPKRLEQMCSAFVPTNGSKYTVVVMSYDVLVQDFDDYIKAIEWDLGVLDEGHYIKSHKAKRTKTAIELRDRCRQRTVLTGTPTTNNFFELFTQLEFLEEGNSGFTSYEKFRKFYGEFVQDDSAGHSIFTGYQNLPLLQEKIARKSFVITKAEALPYLPKKVYKILSCDMTTEQRRIYSSVANQILVESQNSLSGVNTSMEINNVLTKMLRLAEITSGYVSWDAEKDDEGNIVRPKIIDRFDPDPKLELLVGYLKEKFEDSEEKDTGKAIIWTCWTQNIKTISARLELEGIKAVTYHGSTSKKDRTEAEEAFNTDTECKVFIGNSAAGGTGLTLLGYDPLNPDDYKTNCDEEIYYSQNWSMVHREQSEDRCHRKGTRVPIQIVDLVVPGTIDEEIRMRVVEKRVSSYKLSDLKEIMTKLSELQSVLS